MRRADVKGLCPGLAERGGRGAGEEASIEGRFGQGDSQLPGFGDRLGQVASGSLATAYDYEAAGQLVRKSRNGVVERHFLWDRGQMIAELDGNATARIGSMPTTRAPTSRSR